MATSNLSALTKSHRIVAAKKKAKREQIKEIVFDDDARRYAFASLLPLKFISDRVPPPATGNS